MPVSTNRTITIATVQMDVKPDQRDLRLFRADQMIQDAVQLGAELVVLPELFNTGYAYVDENFQRAEPGDGPTITWMKRIARRMGVHLAGSLLLLEEGEIYNAMLVIAPDGRTWRYDKSYPWGWERGYFRENRKKGAERAVIAKTDLGNLGLLVCWDAAHPELWKYYAGQVDMMAICSCPPRISDPTFFLPPNVEISGRGLGPLMAARKKDMQLVFGTMMEEQARWLGVPVAHGASCGQFESPVPNGRTALLVLAASNPGLLRYLSKAGQMTIQAPTIDACRVVSADGRTLAQRLQSQGEGFTIAEVCLPESRPKPHSQQPPSRVTRLSLFLSDTFLPRSVLSVYQQGMRRTRGV